MKNDRIQNSVAVLPLGVPELPDFATTISGVQFNPHSDIWRYQDGLDRVNIDFGSLRLGLSSDLLVTFKSVLVHAAQEISPVSLTRYHTVMTKFLESLNLNSKLEKFDEAIIRRFWMSPVVLEKYKFEFRWIIDRWIKHRYTGVEQPVVDFLRQHKEPSRIIGESVLTWDPVSGPLTDIEFKNFYESMIDSFAEGRIQTQSFLMTWLVTSLGIRPRQVALLKVCDVLRKADNGVESFSISIPRIKQRGQIPRDEMYEWPVINEIGKMLYEHGRNQRAKLEGLVIDLDQSPLFSGDMDFDFDIDRSILPNNLDLGVNEKLKFRGGGGNLSYHMPVSFVIDGLRSVFNEIDVSSERVGSEIVLNARRLRKTYGTRLAADNVPAPVLAAMLGHRDIKSSKPYIAATSRLQDRLDKSLAFELAPLAQAFRGEFLTGQDNASTGATIRDLRVVPSGEQLGKCDKTGYCGYAAPVACYTCKKFRPWKDAPHELIFDFLWERRVSRSTEFEKDAHMTMLHDRTILAVAQVILECGGNVSS